MWGKTHSGNLSESLETQSLPLRCFNITWEDQIGAQCSSFRDNLQARHFTRQRAILYLLEPEESCKKLANNSPPTVSWGQQLTHTYFLDEEAKMWYRKQLQALLSSQQVEQALSCLVCFSVLLLGPGLSLYAHTSGWHTCQSPVLHHSSPWWITHGVTSRRHQPHGQTSSESCCCL